MDTSCPPLTQSHDIPALVCAPDGSTCVNPEKGLVKWFWLRAIGPNNSFPVTFQGNESNMLTITIPAEENLRGDFEIAQLLATSTGRFTTQIMQATINRQFSNAPIPNNHVFGTTVFPGILAETFYAQPTTTLQVQVVNLLSVPNVISMVAVGRRFLDWGNERRADERRRQFYSKRTHPYWLTNNQGVLALAANGSASLLMTVPSSADFLAKFILDDSDGTYNIQVFEGLSSRALMDGPINAQNFFASPTLVVPGFPQNLLRSSMSPGRIRNWSHLFKRSSIIQCQITDTSGLPNNIRLSLHGLLIYYNEPGGERLTINESVTNAGWRRSPPLLQPGMPGRVC